MDLECGHSGSTMKKLFGFEKSYLVLRHVKTTCSYWAIFI